MKLSFIVFFCILASGVIAQATIRKSYPTSPGQAITLKFDYPVVRVSTWDKNEVSVTAHVDINDHENDSAFLILSETIGGGLHISDRIKDMDKLPRRYTIVRNGQKIVYRSKKEYKQASEGGNIERSYEGTDIDIVVEVKVPSQSAVDIQAVYGIVEMVDFHAPVTVDATYGGIDATINTASTGKLKATTSYGEIYTNLDMKITDHTEHDFYNSITAEPGTGPSYNLTSTYGKIYLRKP